MRAGNRYRGKEQWGLDPVRDSITNGTAVRQGAHLGEQQGNVGELAAVLPVGRVLRPRARVVRVDVQRLWIDGRANREGGEGERERERMKERPKEKKKERQQQARVPRRGGQSCSGHPSAASHCPWPVTEPHLEHVLPVHVDRRPVVDARVVLSYGGARVLEAVPCDPHSHQGHQQQQQQSKTGQPGCQCRSARAAAPGRGSFP